MAPSRRTLSPLKYAFSTIVTARWAYSAGVPRRFGNGTDAASEARTLSGKVAISGFGTFEARPRKARVGRNPHTGEALHIPASKAPAFKAGKPLKETLRAH